MGEGRGGERLFDILAQGEGGGRLCGEERLLKRGRLFKEILYGNRYRIPEIVSCWYALFTSKVRNIEDQFLNLKVPPFSRLVLDNIWLKTFSASTAKL